MNDAVVVFLAGKKFVSKSAQLEETKVGTKQLKLTMNSYTLSLVLVPPKWWKKDFSAGANSPITKGVHFASDDKAVVSGAKMSTKFV